MEKIRIFDVPENKMVSSSLCNFGERRFERIIYAEKSISNH